MKAGSKYGYFQPPLPGGRRLLFSIEEGPRAEFREAQQDELRHRDQVIGDIANWGVPERAGYSIGPLMACAGIWLVAAVHGEIQVELKTRRDLG